VASGIISPMKAKVVLEFNCSVFTVKVHTPGKRAKIVYEGSDRDKALDAFHKATVG
jgi:hypothetical protein